MSVERRQHRRARQAQDSRARASSAPIDSKEMLLAKYQELCVKYHDLVTRYETTVASRSGAVSLALTAMRTSTTGLALFHEDRVLAQNVAFDELTRVRGTWRRQGVPQAPARASVQELALHEAQSILRGEGGTQAIARYAHEPSGRVIDVHVERGGKDHTVAVIVHDVTDRCRTERELDEARNASFEQQRMRAVGELASGVAHDLNNALHAVAMRLDALRRAVPAQLADASRHLASLSQIVSDVTVRVGRLQEFARRRHDAPHASVNIVEIVHDAVALARTEVEGMSRRQGRQISIDIELDRDLPHVSGVAAELRHVFLNLLLNARDAMSEGGTIRIAGRAVDGQVFITVSDDGPGIAPENLTRVFEPFFTTKAEKGTGLGLAVAYGVMRRLGGSISAANASERGGAVFTLSFPAVAPPREQPAPVTPRVTVAPGRRVLVIDDDAENLEAMSFVLADLGQTVTTARCGPDAIALFRAGERYDLVLCDLGMPQMNGWQTAREIRAVAPDTRIHMLTGWAQEIAPDDPLRALVDGVQGKPLPLDELERLLSVPAPA